jgi:hypothetical protein
MQDINKDQIGLAEAQAVARGSETPVSGGGDAKLLALFLREGECSAVISESHISVWYSWRPRSLPSRYFVRLAPGVIGRLMQLGGVQNIARETSFSVSPGTVNIGGYPVDFKEKWVRIRCEEDRIVVQVRDAQTDLDDSCPNHFVDVRCERCNSELRTPLAKQCLHCGYDWH